MNNNETPGRVTAGQVIALSDDETVKFPAWFKSAMGSDRGLLVFIRKGQFASIYPIQSENVTFISVEIKELSHNFLKKINKIFNEFGLVDLLFSTGVCHVEKVCYYESYFSPSQLKKGVADLKKAVSELDEVESVVTENLTL